MVAAAAPTEMRRDSDIGDVPLPVRSPDGCRVTRVDQFTIPSRSPWEFLHRLEQKRSGGIDLLRQRPVPTGQL